MMKTLVCACVAVFSMAACSAKVTTPSMADVGADQKPTVQLGRNNGKNLALYSSALMQNLSDSRQYVLVIYGVPTPAPCFGLGDALVTAPLWKSAMMGQTNYSSTDSRFMVEFFDNTAGENRSAYVPGGMLNVTSYDGKNGHAVINVGADGSRDFARGEFDFVSCVSGQE